MESQSNNNSPKTSIAKWLAVGLFTIAILLVSWEELQGSKFTDRATYYEYFKYGVSVLEYKDFGGLVDYIVNEALWHFSVSVLIDDLGVDIDIVFLLISAFCIGVYSTFLVRRHGAASLPLLINPLMIDLAFSQLRGALAFSLLYVAYMARVRTVMYVLMFIAILIHTAALLFIGAALATKLLYQYLNSKGGGERKIFIGLCAIGISISLFIGPFRELILTYFGDRRADYRNVASTITYTLFWVGLLATFAIQERKFIRDEINRFSIVMLSTVSFSLITGAYNARFLAVALPMTLSSMLSLRSVHKFYVILLFIIYATIQWYFWLKIF